FAKHSTKFLARHLLKFEYVGIGSSPNHEPALSSVNTGVALRRAAPRCSWRVAFEINRTSTRPPQAVIGETRYLPAPCLEGDSRVPMLCSRLAVRSFDDTFQVRQPLVATDIGNGIHLLGIKKLRREPAAGFRDDVLGRYGFTGVF